MVTPLVARLMDTNGNGVLIHPIAPASSWLLTPGHTQGGGIPAGIIRVLDGLTGEEKFATTLADAVDGYGTPAIGDIDNDGYPEIVAPAFNRGVIVFAHDGTVKWRTPPLHPSNQWGRVVTLADLDGDGETEIIVARTVLE